MEKAEEIRYTIGNKETYQQRADIYRKLVLGIILSTNFVYNLRLCSIEHNWKNWLFSDTPAGADVNMKVYSMIEMVKANDLGPHQYLNFF